MISFMLQPLYPKDIVSSTNWIGSWVSPHGQSIHFREEINCLKLSLFEPLTVQPLAQYLHWQHYPSSLKYWKDLLIFPLMITLLISWICVTVNVVMYHKWVQIKLPWINVVYGKLSWNIAHHDFATESVIFLFNTAEDKNIESYKLRE